MRIVVKEGCIFNSLDADGRAGGIHKIPQDAVVDAEPVFGGNFYDRDTVVGYRFSAQGYTGITRNLEKVFEVGS